jgi:acetyltransferase-like isoleucine patch superfamily enzyme
MIVRRLNRFNRRVREIIQTKRNLKTIAKYQTVPHIHGNTMLSPNTTVGGNCHFNGMRILGGGKVTIGDNFHSGTNILVLTDFHNYDGGESIPYGKKPVSKDIIIEDNVWIGSNVTILGGVTVGEGAIVQAGSVVVKDIPKYAIAGGHPAIQFAQRNVERYEKLKKEKRYI